MVKLSEIIPIKKSCLIIIGLDRYRI